MQIGNIPSSVPALPGRPAALQTDAERASAEHARKRAPVQSLAPRSSVQVLDADTRARYSASYASLTPDARAGRAQQALAQYTAILHGDERAQLRQMLGVDDYA